jgi:hypothetical protein
MVPTSFTETKKPIHEFKNTILKNCNSLFRATIFAQLYRGVPLTQLLMCKISCYEKMACLGWGCVCFQKLCYID